MLQIVWISTLAEASTSAPTVVELFPTCDAIPLKVNLPSTEGSY